MCTDASIISLSNVISECESMLQVTTLNDKVSPYPSMYLNLNVEENGKPASGLRCLFS